ncbi:MAG: hypothetical protein H6744_13070 [Deltaproteobacteria bacterium]|nr:hypothetical protein [Deltaproteobacteria bacterium]
MGVGARQAAAGRRGRAAPGWMAVFALGCAAAGCSGEATVAADVAAADQGDAAGDLGGGPDSTAPPAGCSGLGTAGATSRCLEPTQPPEYYVDEALKYFDTLDVDADRERIPAYSDLVARWEWPPWLLLTGYERQNLLDTADLLRVGDPSTVPVRDCRFFEVQPFARCYVSFQYEGGSCPIYEEFTFNDQGETTFIEAWSDIPTLNATTDESDRWAEGPTVHRLSTHVPGLGNATGRIDLDSPAMSAAAAEDPEIADFVFRARDMWEAWFDLLAERDDDYFARGCGW